uniref:DUF4283 domain-containing protein n=1 Tax=Kalanchoe fedtschenkoi TaxID=63787 RepID=A0A7N0TIM6_KALFE
MMVSDLDGRHIILILSSEKDATSILTQGPRKVGTSLFRLFRWTSELHFRRESTVISIWIRFSHLRPYLFNEGALRCLCQPFGKFLDSHVHTKNRIRCTFTRCCVEINVTKSLPSEI